jgi:hypothetical protein
MEHDLHSSSVDRDTDDQRYMLAAMAARRARRNRPRRLIALAAIIFAGASVAAVWGASQRTAAAGKLRDARVEQQAVEKLVPMYQEARSRGGVSPYTPVPDLGTRLESYARAAGLDKPLPTPVINDDPRPGYLDTIVRINNLQNSQLPPVTRWLVRVVEEIPGIEIRALEIKPTQQGWTVNVTLVKPTRR